MNDESFVLDTSAILALIEDEEGADRVESLLTGSSVMLPWTALLEVYHITYRERGQAEADRRYAMLKKAATVMWEVDEPLLLTAGRLKGIAKISLADALIAAYAVLQGATLVHKDPEYEALRAEVVQEILPYK